MQSVDVCSDMIWLQQMNGSIFCFMPSNGTGDNQSNERVIEVTPPAEIAGTVVSIAMTFVALCASSDALWGLLPDGRLFVRAGMSAHCPTGVEWIQISLPQISMSSVICQNCLNAAFSVINA
jgi:Propeller